MHMYILNSLESIPARCYVLDARNAERAKM